ncbi:MAG: ribosomal protein S18-alanine N-acetyltransferase [Firmicutes bacterium]|nr:ribosomal protein S18-alanine N-acetyltransferase [Bacillota bacterium]
MIRPALTQDASRIAEIENAYIACTWGGAAIKAAIQNPDYIFFVYIAADILAGYGSLRMIGTEAEVNNIAVDKAFRKRGIANEILQSLLSAAKSAGADTFFLEVSVQNAAAIGLYQKHGFKQIAVRKDYYAKGEDAAVMKLSV